MTIWEYRTLYIKWGKVRYPDGKRGTDWVVEFNDAPPRIGLEEILDVEGQSGWELVSLLPQAWQGTEIHYSVGAYRAVFKRPASAE